MNSGIHEMAEGCYGYGSWTAPCWFIGPEQGMSSNENIQRRVDAWVELGREELSDCCQFHMHIREMRWHGEPPKLQKTWKQLMLLLMAFRGTPLDLEVREDKTKLCRYQQDHWGRANDESCVIELSGLPAHCYESSEKQRHELFEPDQFDSIRQRRIAVIRKRILQYQPKLVVMYGLKEREYWERIASVAKEFPPQTKGPIFTFATHPVSFQGVQNSYWTELGQRLRDDPSPALVS